METLLQVSVAFGHCAVLQEESLVTFACTLMPNTNILTKLKTEFVRGPGRGDTCHLSNLDETLPD